MITKAIVSTSKKVRIPRPDPPAGTPYEEAFAQFHEWASKKFRDDFTRWERLDDAFAAWLDRNPKALGY